MAADGACHRGEHGVVVPARRCYHDTVTTMLHGIGRSRAPSVHTVAPLRTAGHSAILSDMPLTRRFPWLRLALAVLALVAGQVSSARASMGATCPRSDSGHVAGLTGSSLADTVASAEPRDGADHAAHAAHAAVPHHAPDDGPTVPAGAQQCVTSVATLPPLTAVPGVLLAWSAAAVPCWLEARPTSLAPPPPFRPPRAL